MYIFLNVNKYDINFRFAIEFLLLSIILFYSLYSLYTYQHKEHHIFFGDTVLEVAERNVRVMEIKYFEFYCKFYNFDEHFELKMIL